MSRDPMGRILHSVICAPVTSTIRGLSTELPLGTDAGLAHDSVANFDNIFLIDRRHLLRRLGRCDPAAMRAACERLAIAVGCRPHD